MENSVRQRIVSFFLENGVSINSLSKGNKAFQRKMNRQINEGAAITCETISSILESFPDISAEWLLRGKGEMTKEYSCEIHCDEYSIIRERICDLLEHVHLKPSSLSDNPLIQQKLDMQIKGKGAFGVDVIYIVLEKIPAVSAEWLLRGEGEMLKTSSAPATINVDVSKYVNEIENLKREVAKLEGQNELLREQLGMPNKKKVKSA